MGKPNSRALAMRDPALAAAMGILGNPKSNYGGERSRAPSSAFGSEWGSDDGDAGYYGYHGDPSMGFGFGSDTALAAPAVRGMHPAQVAAIVGKHHREQARTQQRENLLHPNKGSRVDIERYDFSINQVPNLTFGVASTIAMSIQPSVTVRPQRRVFNAPSYGFATISSILSANVNGLVGGQLDAGVYNHLGVGIHLDLPTLSPANKLAVNGSYTGLTPPGFPAAFSYQFTATFQCPATVVA